MSVLTAWAAGKFSGEKIAAAVKASGLESSSRRAADHSGLCLADQRGSGGRSARLGGLVGPREAADLGSFLKIQATR